MALAQRPEQEGAASSAAIDGRPSAAGPIASRWQRRRRASWLLAAAAGCTLAFAAWRHPDWFQAAWTWALAAAQVRGPERTAVSPPVAERAPVAAFRDGLIELAEPAVANLGIETEPARPQTAPIRIELLGTTDYVSEALTKVRPMFKGRVDRVYVTVGQEVRKGDPLIEFYSVELAAAKSSYEIERIQWLYDRKLLEIRESLLKSRAVSQQLYDETKNNEMKNRREYEVARDKLLVYGLTPEEIERVPDEAGTEKARITIRSPASGQVISRDVVAGNLYDENDTLLVIAPLDRLWVWGNVFESDLHLVAPGQSWEIEFPFLGYRLKGTVEYISNRVDPDTHALRIRTSIPNQSRDLKADMLVRGMLEIPPQPGQVVVPRTALVVRDGASRVFVQKDHAPPRFEARDVVVVQEKDDHVVIRSGLRSGEPTVTVGALLLDQIYEELRILRTGAPRTASLTGN
jgi:cobalt-zinc-cadmium efflux system membrane fusion protein